MSARLDDACVYSCEVMHQRFTSTPYQFRYRVFSLLLDIDEIDTVTGSSWLFSRNRFNLLSFYDRDHLPSGANDLRSWAEGVMAAGGLSASGVRIRLLCFPRVLGWVFNPLSLWYCEDQHGAPVAVIAEVRNTFGERHCYLLKPQDGQAGWPLRQSHSKDFHVSPFISMDAGYQFRLSRPDEKLRVIIRELQDSRLMLVATQMGRRLPFKNSTLLSQTLRVPFQTLKVLTAIHWHALKIWLQGGQFHRKPAPPIEEVS